MKLGVVGGRHFSDKEYLFKEINLIGLKIDWIVSGGATGADSLAEEYAKAFGIRLKIFKPDFSKLRAYHQRNIQIAEYCDVLIAFPEFKSRGTWDTINEAKKLRKRVIVCQR